ncbi:TolC family protein [Sedimentibacter hydroxybenzoicus DSM 7310]|uniref:TolC family protein n=1 Tax=Sedimentibacter hydroxybenzoicus DSM 7310 TaxID=1123245 RepID=A0A974BL62_SEDHY|nr:TolC family protein [Sedimentibacter hydroxybenzoicus]NYB74660.1 TolC family protein [Sedimentibacter hydroxybenzoicus DSM 7310]
MKRKVSLLLIMILVLSTLTNVVAAEDTAQIGNVSAENKILELSMDEAVRIATENSREMWKIDDGIKQMRDARISGRSAKEQAEELMSMSLSEIAAIRSITGMDPLNNQVEALLAKNGYYIKFAETQITQLEKSREVLIKGIEIGTKSMYYNVLVAEKTIEINQAKLNKANEQLRVVNLKFNNGSSTKAEVLSAEMAIQQAKTDLDSAIDDLNIAKLNLLNMLELPFDTEFVLTDTELPYVPTNKINLDEKIEKAKQDRIEILTAENDLEIQKIETHAYTAYYTSNLRENKWAKEKLKDAELNLPQAYKDVELDVRKTYLNLIKAERSLANMDKTVELAKEAARINKLLYDNGMATSLEVLDADTKLAEVEIGRYQMLAAYNINKLMFDYSDIGTFK